MRVDRQQTGRQNSFTFRSLAHLPLSNELQPERAALKSVRTPLASPPGAKLIFRYWLVVWLSFLPQLLDSFIGSNNPFMP